MYTVGNNDYGQLGNRSHVGSSTPVRVNALDLHKVTHAAYGQNHCLAITEQVCEHVRCVGGLGLHKVTHAANGQNHCLAITEQVCEGVRGGGAGPVQGHTCSLWP